MRLPTAKLHQQFVCDMGRSAESHSDVKSKPLLLDLKPPLPTEMRIYMYNLTAPPGGRSVGEHKINLIVPGQERGTGSRGYFDDLDSRFILLVGYNQSLEVYALWDAMLHNGFPYSKNVQISAATVYEAFSGKVAFQERKIRGSGVSNEVQKRGKETIVACRRSSLVDGIIERFNCTTMRLLGIK